MHFNAYFRLEKIQEILTELDRKQSENRKKNVKSLKSEFFFI